ncbi:hypothetical protein [Aquimarina sp. 2304DJ70-9]|uniref:hypothetical protein n=1 Tax=Aquimarina penaris TaxID=3231044 RepID=UPI0034620571
MKVMTIVMRSMVILLLSAFIFSCSDGEDGAIGPVGPQGEQGADGQEGTDGQNGADGATGETGSANVIYSDWFNSNFPNNNNVTGTTATFSITVPEIDNTAIPSTGVILVYGRNTSPGGSNIYMLPAEVALGRNERYSFFVTISISIPTNLTIQVDGINGDTDPIGIPLLDQYRYIMIPGGVPGEKSRSISEYKNMSYQEITTLFNIPE